MRTTISIHDDLLAEAKRVASATGRTLSEVVEDSLREALSRRTQAGRRPFSMPTFRGGGVRPGVDLDDSAALLDLMDRGESLDQLR